MIKKFILLILTLSITSCVYHDTSRLHKSKDKKFYSSNGFALIYDEKVYEEGILNQKLDNEKIITMHSFLKINTPVKILNPENDVSVETKIYRNSKYPNLFNIVVSKKIAKILKLDPNNPYVEIFEVKKNKTFIAKKSNTFDEEKNVMDTAPVDKVEIDVLVEADSATKIKSKNKSKFVIVISDFYYLDSAKNLKNKLFKLTLLDNLDVKKISNNKYRLLAGPFKNFEALKSTYISLNNQGFNELNIFRE